MTENSEFWMKKTIDSANNSKTPYGAIIVNKKGECIEAYNTVKKDGATAHAEINALLKLSHLQYDNEDELILFSTVEPCPMCMSAIIWAGIGTVIYGADIPFASKYGNQIQIRAKEVVASSWQKPLIIEGILAEDCQKLFQK